MNEGKYSLPKANTNFLKRTVVYRAMKAWNSLPLTMTKLTKKSMFKKPIRKHLEKLYL